MAIEIRRMSPLLEVFDMQASLAFYRDKLGFVLSPIPLGATNRIG